MDHYKPKSKFPEASVDYTNLYYCCSSCNIRKFHYWPEPDQLKILFIPNPCDCVMFDHLRFQGIDVAARSKAGEFTVDRLDLNDPKVLDYRRFVNTSIELYEYRLFETRKLLEETRSNITVGKFTEATASQEILELEQTIADLEIGIARFMGTTPIP